MHSSSSSSAAVSSKFQPRPPPLLADYGTNRASVSEQSLRRTDDAIARTCPHLDDCSGCTTGANVVQTPIVDSAQRFFARQRYDGTSTSRVNQHINDDSNYNKESSYPVVIPSPTTAWRTQAKLVVTSKSSSSWTNNNEGCVFGLYERGSHRLLPIPHCAVHHPSINTAVAALERATAIAGIAGSKQGSGGREQQQHQTNDRNLRFVQLQVERCSGQVSLTLVWNAASLKECQPGLARLIKALNSDDNKNVNDGKPSLWHSIWCHCNNSGGNNIFSRNPGRWHRLQGPEFLREPLPVQANVGVDEDNDDAPPQAAGWLYFTPMTFRQGNLDGFDHLALDVARAVPPGSKVCELYGGVGVLGLTALAYHYHYNNKGLAWLRCSDENPANPRCFQRAVDSLPEAMTGRRLRRRSGGGGNQKHQHGTRRNNDQGSGGGDMTLAELAALMDAGETTKTARNSFADGSQNAREKTSYLIASAGEALRTGQALGANVLIVDPPRRGLEDDVLNCLCQPHDPDQPYVATASLLTVSDDRVRWTNDVQTLL